MKIAYVTTYNAENIRQWSGTGYHIQKCLTDQGAEVIHIGSLNSPWHHVLKTKQLYYRLRFSKRYLRERDPLLLRSYARQVERRLKQTRADVIFSPGTIPISYLDCEQPIVFWADATFAGMVGFYSNFSNLHQKTIARGNEMEQRALDRCRLALFSSDWAAETAIRHYRVDPEKVKVVPYGANIECNRTLADIEELVQARSFDRCRLLFAGVDWRRKGGDLVLRIAEELNNQGLETRLTVLGCQPETAHPLPDFVEVVGFVDKFSAGGREKLDELFGQAHFLMMPSSAEAYGIVLCEANSFGTPCLASAVGGIPTIVKEGKNGFLFPLEEDISALCGRIAGLMTDPEAYRELALSAFDEYETRLNWKAAGETVKELLEGL